jgi:hypothetical protein
MAHRRHWIGTTARAAVCVGALSCAAAVVAPASATAATTAVDCATGSLQAAITSAAAGTTLSVSGFCEGNFDITKDLSLVGLPGAVLSAQNSGNVLGIGAGAGNVSISSLEITDGKAANGAGIYAPDGVRLTLDHVTVDDNVAIGTTNVLGGGVYLVGGGGSLTLRDCTFSANQAEDYGSTAEIVEGGAVYTEVPTTISGSTFAANRALITGSSGQSQSQGGAVDVEAAPLTISSTTFTNNVAHAAETDPGVSDFGAASGAALWVNNANSLAVSIEHSVFSRNRAAASGPNAGGFGAGAEFALGGEGLLTLGSDAFTDNAVSVSITGVNAGNSEGGGFDADAKTTTFSHLTVEGNSVTVTSASAGEAQGGGAHIASGGGTISDSTISGNTASITGATANPSHSTAAIGGGAAILVDTGVLTIARSTFAGNVSRAASPVTSVSALAGGLEMQGVVSPSGHDRIVDSTFTKNRAVVAGTAGSLAEGGAIGVTEPLTLAFDTVVGNSASGKAASQSEGGALQDFNATPLPLIEASLIVGNTAGSASICTGSFASAGYNDFGPVGGCSITPRHTDKTRVSVARARLGRLAANGGPTKTIALGAHSVAVDQIPHTTCRAITKTDQRGVVRPQGTKHGKSKCDIGAYERKPRH